jgi:hypothetical protein
MEVRPSRYLKDQDVIAVCLQRAIPRSSRRSRTMSNSCRRSIHGEIALRSLDSSLARTLTEGRGAQGVSSVVAAKILVKIAGTLVHVQQRFAGSPFGINHVVGLEFEVEVLEFVEFICCIERDRCTVYQFACRQ